MLIDELLNRTRLEKLLRDSYGNYCVQTALDYAEPGQRALLVEGIRPVLPLIRNTPYGKRIQNKLQREQIDHYGGYHNQALVNMAMTNQGLNTIAHGASRHISHQGNPLADMYGQNGLYSQANFGQSHHIQPQSIDGFVLQGNGNHSQGLSSLSQGAGFSGASFNHFGGAGLHSDPYQRVTAFGYGM